MCFTADIHFIRGLCLNNVWAMISVVFMQLLRPKQTSASKCECIYINSNNWKYRNTLFSFSEHNNSLFSLYRLHNAQQNVYCIVCSIDRDRNILFHHQQNFTQILYENCLNPLLSFILWSLIVGIFVCRHIKGNIWLFVQQRMFTVQFEFPCARSTIQKHTHILTIAEREKKRRLLK